MSLDTVIDDRAFMCQVGGSDEDVEEKRDDGKITPFSSFLSKKTSLTFLIKLPMVLTKIKIDSKNDFASNETESTSMNPDITVSSISDDDSSSLNDTPIFFHSTPTLDDP